MRAFTLHIIALSVLKRNFSKRDFLPFMVLEPKENVKSRMIEWRYMKKKYKHLTQKERYRIEALLLGGHKQKTIAKILKVDESTVSREIQRNRRKIRRKGGTISGDYKATVAGQKAYVRRKYSKYQGKKIN